MYFQKKLFLEMKISYKIKMNNTKAVSAIVLIIFAVLALAVSLYYLRSWKKMSSTHNALHLAAILAFVLLLAWGVMLFNDSRKEGYCGAKCGNTDGEPLAILRDGNYTMYSYGPFAPLVNMTGQPGIYFQPELLADSGFYSCCGC